MNFLRKRFIFSLKYLTSPFEYRITTYKKKDLACLYCPNATARCAIRTLTRWIKRNHELYEALAHTGYNVRTRTFMPKQVSLIVQYLDEP